MRAFVCGLGGALTLAASAVAGPDWIEVGDAGGDGGTAQTTRGSGRINSVSGNLGGAIAPDFEDMYYIRVANPDAFKIELATADFDAQLFLFSVDVKGGVFGLLANNDRGVEDPAPRLLNSSTDDSGAKLDTPGLYIIAVAGVGNVPQSDGSIFRFDSLTEISGPDGPGGPFPQFGWTGQGATGRYSFRLEGCEFAELPAPGALGVLGVGALVLGRRRR